MTGLEHAIVGLQQAVDAPRRHGVWRRIVVSRIDGVRDALNRERAREEDAYLAAREQTLARDRTALAQRLSFLARAVLDATDVEPLRGDLQRLLVDLEHHRQRLDDLVYDSVSLELGGSE